MKFTLTYDGELSSNGDYRKKWEIRKQFHPQLQELWRINPSLRNVLRHRHIPLSAGYWKMETHHSLEDDSEPLPPAGAGLDLCAPMKVGAREFMPLVRNTFALTCGLKILFLRKEAPGRVYQGGDLDNRLKTLFDALSAPNDQQLVDDASLDDPIYCLLEDDSLISSVDIETRRLLSRPNASQHEVHLVIDVDVRVTQSRLYNQPFLGD